MQGDKMKPKASLSGNSRKVQPVNNRSIRSNIAFPGFKHRQDKLELRGYGMYGGSDRGNTGFTVLDRPDDGVNCPEPFRQMTYEANSRFEPNHNQDAGVLPSSSYPYKWKQW